MLQNHPEINGLIIVAAGAYGVCRAVLSMEFSPRPIIVSVDNVPTTEEMIREGIIQATVCQQPFQQGYQAVQQAFQYLISGQKPEKERFITTNEIKILENL